MKFIVLLGFVAFLAISAADDWQCEPGVPYIENECNSCFCSPTHALGCTLKACPQVDSARLYNCEVGTSFEKGCNRCYCVKDQGTICENKKC